MKNRSEPAAPAGASAPGGRWRRVWDLPTRLFHWLLVALVGAAFVTANLGGNWMQAHVWCGEAVLGLVIFRVVWGFVGSGPSRFKSFLVGPAAVARYARTLLQRNDSPHPLTHNPLGGWSVVALLLSLTVQAASGLFANDDIATEGPLAKWVSQAVSDRLTSLHHFNHDVIIGLAALHVAAVLFHLIYKRDNLIAAMITGRKAWHGGESGNLEQRPLWTAALAAVFSGGAVYLLVR